MKQSCKGTVIISGKEQPCGSSTKHSSGYCHDHRKLRPIVQREAARGYDKKLCKEMKQAGLMSQ